MATTSRSARNSSGFIEIPTSVTGGGGASRRAWICICFLSILCGTMLDMGQKLCGVCGDEKRHPPNGKPYCYQCRLKANRKYRRANPDSVKKYNRARNEKLGDAGRRAYAASRRYGISQDEATRLYSLEACESCGKPDPNGKSLHIDHDHKTGKVRGALCHGCNVSLGNLHDDPATIIKLLNYLIERS